MGECCVKGFKWDGELNGSETTLAGRDCYVTGNHADIGVMIVHDLGGWTFRNTRMIADHIAEEVGATVYVPDFFGGEIMPIERLMADPSAWSDPEIDLQGFLARNSKVARTPELFEVARLLRSKHKRTGAVGYCFGGWAVFALGARGKNMVDCIATAHPTWLTKEEISGVGVPVQIMAPEFDPEYTPELKTFSNEMIPKLGVPYDWQYFPGLEHAFATRGDPNKNNERQGTLRAKNAVVYWLRTWLKDN